MSQSSVIPALQHEPVSPEDTSGGKEYLPSAAAAKSLQSCPTLSDPMDCSPLGSSVHRIFQARGLERGAISCPLVLIRLQPPSSVIPEETQDVKTQDPGLSQIGKAHTDSLW